MAKKFSALTSWSYSVYTQYLKCPLSVCYDKVQRIKIAEPPNPHFERGDRVHKAAEQFVGSRSGRPSKLTAELEGLRNKLLMLRKAKARTEQEWAFDRDWRQVDWRDWNRAWLRVKTDACLERSKPKPLVRIVDYKTGKVYDDHKQQRSLYALGGLQLVQLGELAGGSAKVSLTAEHWYADTGLTATEEFTMTDLPRLKQEWLARTAQMMADTRYKPNPGYHCRWCRFRKSNGGPCEDEQR